MLLVPLILCFTALTVECRKTPPEVSHEPLVDNLTIIEKWELLEKKLKWSMKSLVKTVLPTMMEVSGSLNISSQCMRDSMILISGIKDIKTWALRLIDASAKVIDGMMDGTTTSLGAYEQCISTNALSERSRDKGRVMFRGQYCTVLIKPPLPPTPTFFKTEEVLEELKNFSQRPTVIGELAKLAQGFYVLSLRMGICVPSGCSLEDMKKVVTLVSNYLMLEATVSRCEVKTEPEVTNLMIWVMFAYSLAGFVLLIATFLDVYAHYNKRVFTHKIVKILLAFSIFTNFQKLVNTDTSFKTLSCLHGIRFLSITWVVLGHTYFFVNFQLITGIRSAIAIPKDFAFQAVLNASLSVDTFFFMGGLLVCYFVIKLVKQENYPFHVAVYILHRLLRILPTYTFTIMFIFMLPLLGSGPIWHETIDHHIENCFNNWWTNLLFINNFFNANQMCIAPSWYLASDVQLYIAGLVILIPLLRWPKLGIALSVLGIIASMAYVGISTYINNYPPTMLALSPDVNHALNFWGSFYFKPFMHAGPYCIGLLTGYLLVTKPNLKIPRAVLVLGWSLAICFSMSVVYGTWEWNKGVEPTILETIFYSSCHRVVWTLSVAWMIVCCCLGYGGVVNYILTWKCWIPVSRLTFTIYLIHPIIQVVFVGNIRTEIQPSQFIAVWLFFGYLCATCGCAFVATMLIEAPFRSLEKIFLPSPDQIKKMNSVIADNNHLKGSLQVSKDKDIAVIVPEAIGDGLKRHDENCMSRL